MGNMVIATPGSDHAALSGSPTVSAMPMHNLQRTQPTDRMRSLDLGDLHIIATLAAPAQRNLVALLYINATPDATWRVRADDDPNDLISTPAYDSGVMDLWPNPDVGTGHVIHAVHWFPSQLLSYWRIDVMDATNPAGYIDIGRLYISDAWQLPVNISYGWDVRFIDPSPKDRSKGSQLYAERMSKWRELHASMDWLNQTQMYAGQYELQRRRGTTEDVFVIRDPDDPHLLQQSVYGSMSILQPLVHARTQIFRSRIIVEEML